MASANGEECGKSLQAPPAAQACSAWLDFGSQNLQPRQLLIAFATLKRFSMERHWLSAPTAL